MVAGRIALERIADLMAEQQVGLEYLVESTGMDRRVVEAIACQRYTPSPEQRRRICGVLGVPREQVIWGHLHTVESHIHQPV